MRKLKFITGFGLLFILLCPLTFAQGDDNTWTLNRCIEYALQQNISVQKSELNKQTCDIDLEQAEASRFPSVSASAGGNIAWGKTFNEQINEYGDYSTSKNINVGLKSSVTLFNGFKTENNIRQSKLTAKSSWFEAETKKESVSLSILDAYLQVLYSKEQVKNSEKQIESTQGQLFLAEERLTLGAISMSDYLTVKSELATEQLTQANASNLLSSNKLNLMQIMELPSSLDFDIEYPVFDDLNLKQDNLNADSIYNIALTVKPQIKSSELSIQKAEIGIRIAQAAYQPQLTLNGSVGTGYDYGDNLAFDYQMRNKINPTVGLSLSVPLYQNKQAKSGVSLAKVNYQTSTLDAVETRNQLRKEVEQAVSDVIAAEKKYSASLEQFNAVNEAYKVASEKYNQGLLNSVDFIIQKTKLINAESEFLQSKYNLVFSYKILDFYQGKPFTF